MDAADLDLAGKRAAVVGGTGGLGRAIARLLAERGAEVVVVGRTFRDEGVPRMRFLAADLESMAEAKRVGRDRPEATATPRVFVMGFPGTNHAGDVEDAGSEKRYRAMDAHMNTVAGNEALVLDAARRHPNLNAYGLNPGLVRTEIRSNFLGKGSVRHRIVEALIGLLAPSAQTYARRIVPLLVSPDIESASGFHFDAKALAIQPSEVMTEAHVRRWMEASAALVARATARSIA